MHVLQKNCDDISFIAALFSNQVTNSKESQNMKTKESCLFEGEIFFIIEVILSHGSKWENLKTQRIIYYHKFKNCMVYNPEIVWYITLKLYGIEP